MGWSCRKDAMDTLRKIETACRASTGMQNTWKAKGKSYFLEICGLTEHGDGAIT